MGVYYPPVGFHFRVEVQDVGAADQDMRFTEVSGLSVELATEELAEGGENRFVQKYPSRRKYPELTLKRGLLRDSRVHDWMRKCIEDFQFEPHDLRVFLLNEEHQPLLTWNVVNAYPTKWSVSDLSATNNAVVVESLQLFYQHFTLIRT